IKSLGSSMRPRVPCGLCFLPTLNQSFPRKVPVPQFDITIAGELNLDIILYGLPEELPLEQELLASGLVVTLGSSSAITAHNLSVLGTQVGFITRVGDDALGRVALDRLRAAAVDLTRI